MMEAYQRLEREWAEFNDLDPAGMVACSSGTAALHLALEALRLPPGSEVIIPNFTMVACPRAVVLAGLRPVFVDCRHEDLLMDQQFLIDATHHSKACVEAIMVVHVYGRRFNVEETVGFYDPEPAPPPKIVEDLAEVHGIRPSEVTDAACWSFYKNKIVAGEEGGAVWFRDPEHAKLARQLRSLGFTDAHDFDHVPRGHNYRLANCLADKVLDSMDGYDLSVRKRRDVEHLYDQDCPDEWRMPPRQAPWVYDIRIRGAKGTEDEWELDRVVAVLKAEGISARHGFKPMTSMAEFRGVANLSLSESNAGRASREVLYLPLTEYFPQAFPTIRKILGK